MNYMNTRPKYVDINVLFVTHYQEYDGHVANIKLFWSDIGLEFIYSLYHNPFSSIDSNITSNTILIALFVAHGVF